MNHDTIKMLRQSIEMAKVAEERAASVRTRMTSPEVPAAKRPGVYKEISK